MNTTPKRRQSHTTAEILKRASAIKLLIMDVDGVLTDGGIIFDSKGHEIKIFDVKDGHGIKMLHDCGIMTAVITGRQSEIVSKRALELGITYIYQASADKSLAYNEMKQSSSLNDNEIACIGDDINDIPLFKRAGFAIAVKDAVHEVKQLAHYVTKNKGGKGAVREVCELILKSQDKWQGVLDAYLQI
ncbi:MAG: HAD-IIIA family hydrolase [Thermodesulfovibrionales bacterium]|nr:HAD-IIIA family hydrolase [Thermodesulfovibrionales bacterium]